MKIAITWFFLCLFAGHAEAQWQTPNHSVPQGRGSGITGFGSAGPGAMNLPFLGNGPTADGSFRALPQFGNFVFASDYLGTKTCDGVTDVSAELQTFLTLFALNGTSGKAVTGIFPPGECFLDSATSLTLTISGPPAPLGYPVHYHLLGYGTTLTPATTRATSGLLVKRGTLATHGDEQLQITVEGLSIKQHNNANAQYGIEVSGVGYVRTFRNQIYAGDENGVHNQGNYACIYYHQGNLSDPDTGPFFGSIEQNNCKGVGVGGSVSGVPIGILLVGTGNALVIRGNSINQGTYGIISTNGCAAPPDANCAATSGGVVVTENAFEHLVSAFRFSNTVPAFSSIVGWQIYGNRFENITSGAMIEMNGVTLATSFPMSVGPNTYINVPTLLSNPNNIPIDMKDVYPGQVTIDAANLPANTTTVIGSAAALGSQVGMLCVVSVSGDTLGVIPTCTAGLNVITFRNTNATSGAIDLGSLKYRGQASFAF